MTVFASPTFTADYQGLCNKIADVLNRQDLLAAIPDFTVLATKRIQRDMARLRHPMAMNRAQAEATNDYVPVPSDFASIYQIMDTDTGRALEYLSPEQSKNVQFAGFQPKTTDLFPQFSNNTSAGGPVYYTLIGNQFRILPPPGASTPQNLDLWYFTTLANLTTVNSTNWALTRFPDLYLYGSLVHSAPYLKADERIQVWEAFYQAILKDIETESEHAVRPQTKLSAARRSF